MLDLPKTTSKRREEILQKLVAKSTIVDTGFVLDSKPSPCFLWTGPTSGNGRGGGYGRMSLNGQTVATHIVAYTHFYGYVPSGRQVDHLCCQRGCWNPAHLDLVTHLQNQKRRDKRRSDAQR